MESGLVPLREAALGVLRLPDADGSGLPDAALQYLALRQCLTDSPVATESPASVCRLLLADEEGARGICLRFAGDMALYMGGPLRELGAGQPDTDRTRAALHVLCRELSVLVAVKRLGCLALPAPALRQGLWLIILHLRHHHSDWPKGSLTVLVRHLLVLQWWLMSEPDGGSVDLSPVMQRTGRLLSHWRQAPGLADLQTPGLDAAVRCRVVKELRAGLWTLSRELSGGSGRAVSPSLCTSLSRLHLVLHLTAYRTLAWWSDSLQQSLLSRLQTGRPIGSGWRSRLLHFRQAVLAGPANTYTAQGAAVATPLHDEALLEVVGDESRLLSAQQYRMAQVIPVAPGAGESGAQGVREPFRQRQAGVIDQLSGGMTRLPDPAALFRALESDGATSERTALVDSVARELAVLEEGARMLGVSRIEALAAVLRSVYRQIGREGGQEGAAPDRDYLLALRRGHAGLLHRLDQAAAWQTISRPQPVIEYLYRFLEARQSGWTCDGLSVPQRCLAINRRLQALLESAAPESVARDRYTLMATLMNDQARLLRTLTAAHRNQSGQRV
jgi:hypothetical protein